MTRPSIQSPCGADRHHAARERIAEFHFDQGIGGLISLRTLDDGTHRIDVYRVSPEVRIMIPAANHQPTEEDSRGADEAIVSALLAQLEDVPRDAALAALRRAIFDMSREPAAPADRAGTAEYYADAYVASGPDDPDDEDLFLAQRARDLVTGTAKIAARPARRCDPACPGYFLNVERDRTERCDECWRDAPDAEALDDAEAAAVRLAARAARMLIARARVRYPKRGAVSYRIADGPHAGAEFFASDDPAADRITPGTTVSITYHPDDQYARRVRAQGVPDVR